MSVSEVPIGYSGRGRQADPRDRVRIFVNGKSTYLVVYPRGELVAHMSDWPFVSAAFLSNGTGAIDGLKLTRAERGYKLRRFGKYRPVLNLNLCRAAVALLDINGDEDDDFDNVIGSIEGDAVVFSLPKVIKGQWRNFFKITRS